jgi:hypothetical protein
VAARPVLGGVAEKNHIAAEDDAAIVAAQFGTRPTELGWKLGKVFAIIGEFLDETIATARLLLSRSM